jgi:hypothetical protein
MAASDDARPQPLEHLQLSAEREVPLGVSARAMRLAAESALTAAMTYQGRLPESVLAAVGMSGRKYRLFINNLISLLTGPRYLEIGAWTGSTLCAAIHGNDVAALTVDDWGRHDGPVQLFYRHVAESVGGTTRLSVVNEDFRHVDYEHFGPFNVFLYDGPHGPRDHYDGLAAALPALDRQFVYITPNWNWRQVREGADDALKGLGLGVEWSAEIRTTLDESHPDVVQQNSDWHNGYLIAVVTH